MNLEITRNFGIENGKDQSKLTRTDLNHPINHLYRYVSNESEFSKKVE